jgi:hypothetical protein
MPVAPLLGGWSVPRIERIRSIERRRLASLEIPGLLGSVSQDLGSESLRVEIVGSLHGAELREQFFTEVRSKFQAGEPVDFVADIVTATELEQVLIEDLELVETNDYADSFHYRLVLREYVEPPPPATALDDLGADLGLDAELDLLADLSLDAFELPDLIDVPALSNPVAPILPALDGTKAAIEPLASLLSNLKGVFD